MQTQSQSQIQSQLVMMLLKNHGDVFASDVFFGFHNDDIFFIHDVFASDIFFGFYKHKMSKILAGVFAPPHKHVKKIVL